DLDGKLAAVLAPARELAPFAHRARARLPKVGCAVSDVAPPVALRNEKLDRSTDELIARIAEHLLSNPVRHDHAPRGVHHDDRIGRRLEKPLKGRRAW